MNEDVGRGAEVLIEDEDLEAAAEVKDVLEAEVAIEKVVDILVVEVLVLCLRASGVNDQLVFVELYFLPTEMVREYLYMF